MAEQNTEQKYVLTKREVNLTCWLVIFLHRVAQCMEYFYGTGVCFGMIPVLKKLYGHDDEKMKAALHRHLTPYISEMLWGHCIIGAAVAMEEQMANGAEITPESITAVKTGLMGPFAGLGDTINYFIAMPIILSILIPYSMQGSIIGVFGIPILGIFTHTVGYMTYQFGYKRGKNSLLEILRGGWIEQIMIGAGVLGMFMMGALAANYVSLKTPLKFTIGQSTFAVQSFFDAIIPGFLPFVLLVLSYLYLSKGGKNTRLMLMFLALGVIGSIIGIF